MIEDDASRGPKDDPDAPLRDDAQDRIEALADMMARLPGLGPRSARRAVLHMIKRRALLMTPLADALHEVAATARECVNCGNVSTAQLCGLCTDERRRTGTLVVVEDVSDLWAMERSGAHKGRYHVLGGLLSALGGTGPEDLRIPRIADRIGAEGIEEIVLALPATVDGQTTAHYIADALEDRTKVTTLAQGVPVGGELDYLDDGTIGAAMKARRGL